MPCRGLAFLPCCQEAKCEPLSLFHLIIYDQGDSCVNRNAPCDCQLPVHVRSRSSTSPCQSNCQHEHLSRTKVPTSGHLRTRTPSPSSYRLSLPPVHPN